MQCAGHPKGIQGYVFCRINYILSVFPFSSLGGEIPAHDYIGHAKSGKVTQFGSEQRGKERVCDSVDL